MLPNAFLHSYGFITTSCWNYIRPADRRRRREARGGRRRRRKEELRKLGLVKNKYSFIQIKD